VRERLSGVLLASNTIEGACCCPPPGGLAESARPGGGLVPEGTRSAEDKHAHPSARQAETRPWESAATFPFEEETGVPPASGVVSSPWGGPLGTPLRGVCCCPPPGGLAESARPGGVLVPERTRPAFGKHAHPSARRLTATFPFRGREKKRPAAVLLHPPGVLLAKHTRGGRRQGTSGNGVEMAVAVGALAQLPVDRGSAFGARSDALVPRSRPVPVDTWLAGFEERT
jgi:hypothetical protein